MAKKNKLFDDDSEEEVTIKTENEYAKKYDTWREKEELYKLEQKYGSKNLESGETGSSDSDDDSEPLEVSEEVEKQFLKTLSLLKTKDPRIYDPNFKCFDEKIEKEKEKKSEPKQLTFADSDDDDEDDNPNIFSIEKKAEISDDEEKDMTKESKDGKIKDYLIGKEEHIDEEVEKDLAPLRALWSDPKLNDGEAFLRDYILNKRYLEDGDTGAEEKLRDDEDLEEDEKQVEEQGKFERAYNFRFEEPDEEYLKRFPRTMNYIRPKDDKRSRKRAELRTRKEEEKRRKMEEIARLKALKLKEIREKIEKIKEVTGNQDLAFKEEDIESDFDPDEHDKRMKRIFDEQYYGEADDQKPVFPDLDEELEIENWDKYNETGEQEVAATEELHCEDDDFNMDADYDPKKAKENLLDELKKNMGKKRRNRKRKSKLAELLSEEKPKFVPDIDKTYSQFMEEYYKMDCEDVIGGDLPTRFKYREVVPNDYGLTIEEILLADDKELTQWVPLKKIVKYRPDNVEKGEVKVYSQKAADKKLKKKILPSLFKDLPEEPEVVVPIEKKKKKKKNKEQNQASEIEVDNDLNGDSINTENYTNNEEHVENGETVEENVSKRSKKKKKNKQQNQMSEIDHDNQVNDDSTKIENTVIENGDTEDQKVRRKKKKKNNEFVVENTEDVVPSQYDQQIATKNKHVKEDSKQKLKRKVENTRETEIPKKKRKKSKQKPNVPPQNSGKSEKQSKSKLQQKTKYGKEKDGSDPMSHLSDERLKAYGLNPKKYRSFLKYKKF